MECVILVVVFTFFSVQIISYWALCIWILALHMLVVLLDAHLVDMISLGLLQIIGISSTQNSSSWHVVFM